MRKLIATASATVLIAGTVPTMASGGGSGNDCSHGQAGSKNPHCNGGKPGGNPYQGNGCPSFLLALGMCKRP
jgi:hypothetical protein